MDSMRMRDRITAGEIFWKDTYDVRKLVSRTAVGSDATRYLIVGRANGMLPYIASGI